MRVAVALLCDAAMANPDGKLYIIGGGIDTLFTSAVPWNAQPFALALKIEFSPSEADRPHTVEVQLVDPDGHSIFPAMKSLVVPKRHSAHPTRLIGANLVMNLFGVPIQEYGDHAFHILVDGVEQLSLPLYIERQAPSARN